MLQNLKTCFSRLRKYLETGAVLLKCPPHLSFTCQYVCHRYSFLGNMEFSSVMKSTPRGTMEETPSVPVTDREWR